MKKFITLLISMVMIFPCIACGGPKDDASVITVYAYDGGYGVQWINDIANKYTAKTGNQVHVETFTGQQGVTSIREEIISKSSNADLIVSKDMMFDEIYKGSITVKGTKYDNLLEDLTSVYNTKIDGEEVTLKEKMDPTFSDYYLVDDKYYAVPWASGMIGLIRNLDKWDDSWKVPNTTDELFALADKVVKSGLPPFIYALDDEYWSMFSHVWIAQYMGSENMKNFYNGLDANGDPLDEKMFENPAFNSTLEILERLLKDKDENGNKKGYMHSSSITTDFTNMQGTFLQGGALMTPNGDWIEREMKANYQNVNIEFIKTPVNSAIANKCSFKSQANKDEILSSLITYVDANPTGYENKPANTTNADVDIVRDARKIEYTVGNEHYMAIPSYANAKDKAKDFLLYMASDEAIDQYVTSTGGCVLPYNYNYDIENDNTDRYSPFRKATSALIEKSNLMFASKKDRLFSIGHVDLYWYNDKTCKVIDSLGKINGSMTAEQIMTKNNAYLSKNWSRILRDAGLN